MIPNNLGRALSESLYNQLISLGNSGLRISLGSDLLLRDSVHLYVPADSSISLFTFVSVNRVMAISPMIVWES